MKLDEAAYGAVVGSLHIVWEKAGRKFCALPVIGYAGAAISLALTGLPGAIASG